MDALKYATIIVTKLVTSGHQAYFAGGWVRDYVMGHPSEDIDIATSAFPDQIMDLFPQTILVGLSFGVVIVVMEGHQFEVATFRKDLQYLDGRHPEAIQFSTAQEDAYRRDFTINGMFYDPLEKVVLDYVQGREDINKRLVRTIGNPHERFGEDRLRMIRAFRFSARFSFNIDLQTQQAIQENAERLFPAVAMERVWQEFNKMVAYPRFDQAIVEMHRLRLLDVIFPELENLHLHDLRHLVAAYPFFPKESPTLLYLMELFPNQPFEDKIEIAKRIKAPGREIKSLEFMHQLQLILEREKEQDVVDDYSWAHVMSHPFYPLGIAIVAARHHQEPERQAFLTRHQTRFDRLSRHIKRIQTKQPVVSSDLLKQSGIKPGIKMGFLLKKAEQMAINENLQEAAPILAFLQLLPEWSQ